MDHEHFAKIFKALSNPNRLRLFDEIRAKGHAHFEDAKKRGVAGCLLQHVIEALDVGAPTVSHHLKELVNAGLVETHKVGKQLRCSVVHDVVDDLQRYFGREPGPAA
ncbi:MAG: ArsR family transcriptional regulator [Deltaproteobacteria bacterium]|nr:MAG: ArsR family transcriptional regulator [Deltaproteobacteria bacterium]